MLRVAQLDSPGGYSIAVPSNRAYHVSVPSRKSPQEKKRLSYERDRRNTYGENDKASRKSIPLRKRLRARAPRHKLNQQLADGLKLGVLDEGEHIDAEIAPPKPRSWRKIPDKPLGEYLARRKSRR